MTDYAIPLKKFEFYPDKPMEASISCLKSYNSDYCAVSKMDGWNLFICNDGGNVEFYSRTWNPLLVCDKVKKIWEEMIAGRKIPDRSIINAEWMKHRAGMGNNYKYDGVECVYLLTPYALDGIFVGHYPYHKRRKWLESLETPVDNIEITKSSEMTDPIVLPAISYVNFVEFYELHKSVLRTEGIVIYNNNGTLMANQNSSVKSNQMYKIKYRSGDDGRTI